MKLKIHLFAVILFVDLLLVTVILSLTGVWIEQYYVDSSIVPYIVPIVTLIIIVVSAEAISRILMKNSFQNIQMVDAEGDL